MDTNNEQTKRGILTYIAKGEAKGVKFKDEPGIWYNPADEYAKDMIKDEYINKEVEIVLDKKNPRKFLSMVPAKPRPEGQPIQEELVKDKPKENTGTESVKIPEAVPQQEQEKITPVNDDSNDVVSHEIYSKSKECQDCPESCKEESRIFSKLSAIQSELKVPKSQRNEFAKFNYRSTSDILEALKPLLQKYKVSIILSDNVQEIGNRVYIRANAVLVDNETGKRIIALGFAREQNEKKGMDEAQITGSASSYARKYALNGLFAIDDAVDIDSQNNTEK